MSETGADLGCAAPATITVAIPTYRRAELLRQALASVQAQSMPPDEVLVSDDAPGDGAAEAIVQAMASQVAYPVRYLARSEGSRGLGPNVNHLITQASGTWFLLLHDDDLLLPQTVARYRDLLRFGGFVAAYGNQQWIDFSGRVDAAASRDLNRAFQRVPERAGLQPDAYRAAWEQQFPNDGYLVNTQAARACGGLDLEYGNAAEVVLGLRLAAYGKFYYLAEDLAQYRAEGDSLGRSRSDDSAMQFLRLAEEQRRARPGAAAVIDAACRTRVAAAIVQALAHGRRDLAWRWFWSYHHRPLWLTPGALRRGLALFRAVASRNASP